MIIREVAPETTGAARQVLVLDLLHAAATARDRSDRALAHAIRAALQCGLTWRTIAAGTRLSHGEVLCCPDGRAIRDRAAGCPERESVG